MLSIIIGIVIIAVLIFVGIEIKINDTIFSVIFVGVILSALGIGLFYPAKGFTDWQLVKETELVTLSNSAKAILQEYHRKGKMSIWSFAFLSDETRYVFRVPKGTISREVALK